jgi:hypothetical protein
MAVPTDYKKPRKLNFVSFLLFLVALALIYLAVQFGPPYWRKWQVKGVLAESANAIYPKRFLAGDTAYGFMSKVQQDTIKRLRNECGIEDKGLTVSVHKDRVNITVGADYRERINHPFVGQSTVLHFRPYSQLAITR